MPQDLCRALAWEQHASEYRALQDMGAAQRKPSGPALSAARQSYLTVYWQIAGALGERTAQQAIPGAAHP